MYSEEEELEKEISSSANLGRILYYGECKLFEWSKLYRSLNKVTALVS